MLRLLLGGCPLSCLCAGDLAELVEHVNVIVLGKDANICPLAFACVV